jgi:hypothetical protein
MHAVAQAVAHLPQAQPWRRTNAGSVAQVASRMPIAYRVHTGVVQPASSVVHMDNTHIVQGVSIGPASPVHCGVVQAQGWPPQDAPVGPVLVPT